MNTVYLLLGSNAGERKEILKKAIEQLDRKVGKIKRVSPLYETEPWGNRQQALFLNLAVMAETVLTAQAILAILIEIERTFGRERIERWAARTLDIDILYFNDEIIVTEDLKIPHAELHNRNFVLAPLADIAPEKVHPVFNVTNKELLRRSRDLLGVRRLD